MPMFSCVEHGTMANPLLLFINTCTVLYIYVHTYIFVCIELYIKSSCVVGWIVQKGRTDEVDKNAILEYCVQLLQESMKNT